MGNASAPPVPAPAPGSTGAPLRELPGVLLATALVSLVPALVAAVLVSSRTPWGLAASAVLAIVLSAAASHLGAALWARRPGVPDVLFADLMLWGWLRRRSAEQRLAATQRRLQAADAAATPMPIAALARMGRLLEARDVYTYGHSRRVARHAQTIARGLRLPAGGSLLAVAERV